MAALAFEYDPTNKMRHTTYWGEGDAPESEWPESKYAGQSDMSHITATTPVDFRTKPDKIFMAIEGDGSMPPEEIFTSAINVLNGKLATIQNELKNLIDTNNAGGFYQRKMLLWNLLIRPFFFFFLQVHESSRREKEKEKEKKKKE